MLENNYRKPKTTTFTELVVKGLLLFSIFTVLQGQKAFESINRIWLIAVCVVLCARLVTYTYTLREMAVLLVTVILHVIAVVFTEFPMYNSNMLFYFLMWVLLYLFFAKSKDRILEILEESKGYINSVLWIWTLLVGSSLFFSASYHDSFFVSFAGTSFRLMPAVLIITALSMYMAVSWKDWRYHLFLILPTYAAFMSESRTYFGVYLLFLLMYIYMRIKSKRNFVLVMIPLICLAVGAFMISSVADKFAAVWENAASREMFLAAFTNGRTIFWVWDLEAFFDLPRWQQFVGNGFDFAFEVTAKLDNGKAIWAHNDIINLLMNFGYIGVVIYLWAFIKLVRTFMPKGNRIPVFVKILFFTGVFFNSMMNMSYTYFCAVIAYPLFLCAVEAKYSENAK